MTRKGKMLILFILMIMGVSALGVFTWRTWYSGSSEKTIGDLVLTPLLEEEGKTPVPVTFKTLCQKKKFEGPLYVVFWATWCPYCLRDLPALVTLARDHVNMVFLDVDPQPSKAAQHILDQGFEDVAMYQDEEQKVSQAFHVKGMPTIYKLNKNCTMVESDHVGPINEGTLAIFFDLNVKEL